MAYKYPWTNLHELNLDWILDRVKELHITQEDIDTIQEIYAEMSPYVFPTVKTYGAVGDGVTDDTQAIIDCITNEKLVLFPPGTYKIGSPIVLTSISDRFLTGWPWATIDTSDYRPGFDYGTNLTVSNLEFIGDNNGLADTNLTFYYCKDVYVKNCRFLNARNLGLELSSCGHSVVEDCEIAHTRDSCGLSFSTEPAAENSEYGYYAERFVLNCYCHDCGLDGIIADAHRVTISNCVLNNNGTSIPAGGVYASTHNYIHIDNTTCRSNTGNGIDIDRCYSITITDCVCQYNNSAGIMLAATDASTIRDCYCSNNGADPQHDGSVYQEGGIALIKKLVNGVMTSCDRINISGCSLNDNTEYGIRLYSVNTCKIDKLACQGNGTGAMYLEGDWYEADYTQQTTPMT